MVWRIEALVEKGTDVPDYTWWSYDGSANFKLWDRQPWLELRRAHGDGLRLVIIKLQLVVGHPVSDVCDTSIDPLNRVHTSMLYSLGEAIHTLVCHQHRDADGVHV